MIWKPHPINHYYAKTHLLITSIISSSSLGRLKTRMIWVCRWLFFGMVCVGRLLLSCKWCKSMTSQLPLCNVKRDHEYLPTYLLTDLPSKNNYLLWSPTKWTNRAEQYRTELIWIGSMDEIYSFICLLYTFVLPCSAHHDASSFASFLCAIFVRSFGCGDAVAEALWMRCVFPPSPAFHTGTVLSFFFFSPNPLSFRNCLFFFNSPCFSF